MYQSFSFFLIENVERPQDIIAHLAREISDQKRIDLSIAIATQASLSSSLLQLPPPSLTTSTSMGTGQPAISPGGISGVSGGGGGGAIGGGDGWDSGSGLGSAFVLPGMGMGIGIGGGHVGNGANIHVVLPGDRDAQKKRHKAKVAYHEKGQ